MEVAVKEPDVGQGDVVDGAANEVDGGAEDGVGGADYGGGKGNEEGGGTQCLATSNCGRKSKQGRGKRKWQREHGAPNFLHMVHHE